MATRRLSARYDGVASRYQAGTLKLDPDLPQAVSVTWHFKLQISNSSSTTTKKEKKGPVEARGEKK